MVVVVCAFADEGELFFCLLGHVGEEGVPIFLVHFGLAPDAELKHILSRFFLYEGFRPLHRLLSFGVNHVHLWRKRVSVDLYFFLFLVGKDKPTLIEFFLYLLLKSEVFACSMAP